MFQIKNIDNTILFVKKYTDTKQLKNIRSDNVQISTS